VDANQNMNIVPCLAAHRWSCTNAVRELGLFLRVSRELRITCEHSNQQLEFFIMFRIMNLTDM
jgi:hypothetical protein